ncbi:MAG TPA: DUF2809 domain-containing protein [Archangium sp.]|nr:DUF2809 domain-containing protein [Archangium sp.]
MPRQPDSVRRFHLIAAGGFLAACVFVFFYRGPGWRFTRGTLGDLFVVGILYHLLSVFWRGSVAARASVIAGVALGVELAQWAGIFNAKPTDPLVIVTGHTFDVWDLVAYALGIALAVALERGWSGRAVPPR